MPVDRALSPHTLLDDKTAMDDDGYRYQELPRRGVDRQVTHSSWPIDEKRYAGSEVDGEKLDD